MRKIKFRAWDAKQNNYVGYIQATSAGFKQVHDVRAFFAESPSLIYQQYTGLKDKNGVEIYEGDIILMYGLHFAVEWDVIRAGFMMRPSNTHQSPKRLSTAVRDGKVIGNIYENPELREQAA